jgi:nicotinamide riboside transporter PnuC
MNYLSAIALLLSMTGTIFNARKKISGFIIWIVADALWFVINIRAAIKSDTLGEHNQAIDLYIQAGIMIFYIFLAVGGFVYWRRGK